MAEITEENGKQKIENETKKSLLHFEASRIFTHEWPSDKNGLQALEHQLEFAGGFCKQMETIDLSTPPNVRLDVYKVLDSLRCKINHPTRLPQPNRSITSVTNFTIPNVGELVSTDQVKDLVENFCNVLGTPDKPTAVNTLTLPCDEVSTEFYLGNLGWIDQFSTRHSVSIIRVVS